MVSSSVEFAQAHSRRVALLELIREQPGLGFRQLARAAGLPHGSLQYHTSVLIRVGLIWTTGHGPRRVHFPGAHPQNALAVRAAVIEHALDPFERRILEFVRAAHGTVQKAILEAGLGRPSSSIQHHIYRLRGYGLLTERRAGRFVVYEEAGL